MNVITTYEAALPSSQGPIHKTNQRLRGPSAGGMAVPASEDTASMMKEGSTLVEGNLGINNNLCGGMLSPEVSSSGGNQVVFTTSVSSAVNTNSFRSTRRNMVRPQGPELVMMVQKNPPALGIHSSPQQVPATLPTNFFKEMPQGAQAFATTLPGTAMHALNIQQQHQQPLQTPTHGQAVPIANNLTHLIHGGAIAKAQTHSVPVVGSNVVSGLQPTVPLAAGWQLELIPPGLIPASIASAAQQQQQQQHLLFHQQEGQIQVMQQVQHQIQQQQIQAQFMQQHLQHQLHYMQQQLAQQQLQQQMQQVHQPFLQAQAEDIIFPQSAVVTHITPGIPTTLPVTPVATVTNDCEMTLNPPYVQAYPTTNSQGQPQQVKSPTGFMGTSIVATASVSTKPIGIMSSVSTATMTSSASQVGSQTVAEPQGMTPKPGLSGRTNIQTNPALQFYEGRRNLQPPSISTTRTDDDEDKMAYQGQSKPVNVKTTLATMPKPTESMKTVKSATTDKNCQRDATTSKQGSEIEEPQGAKRYQLLRKLLTPGQTKGQCVPVKRTLAPCEAFAPGDEEVSEQGISISTRKRNLIEGPERSGDGNNPTCCEKETRVCSDGFPALTTSSGNQKLVDTDGFMYIKAQQDGDYTRWVCDQTSICDARAWTLENKIVQLSYGYTHATDKGRSHASVLVQRDIETVQDMDQIVNTEGETLVNDNLHAESERYSIGSMHQCASDTFSESKEEEINDAPDLEEHDLAMEPEGETLHVLKTGHLQADTHNGSCSKIKDFPFEADDIDGVPLPETCSPLQGCSEIINFILESDDWEPPSPADSSQSEAMEGLVDMDNSEGKLSPYLAPSEKWHSKYLENNTNQFDVHSGPYPPDHPVKPDDNAERTRICEELNCSPMKKKIKSSVPLHVNGNPNESRKDDECKEIEETTVITFNDEKVNILSSNKIGVPREVPFRIKEKGNISTSGESLIEAPKNAHLVVSEEVHDDFANGYCVCDSLEERKVKVEDHAITTDKCEKDVENTVIHVPCEAICPSDSEIELEPQEHMSPEVSKGDNLSGHNHAVPATCEDRFGVIAPARFVPGRKNKILLDTEGYSYRRDQLCGVKTYWRCTARKGCTARAHTVGNNIVKLGGTHTHAVPGSHEDQRSHEKDCADTNLLGKRQVEKFRLHSQDEGLLEYSQSKHFPTERNHASAEKIYKKDKKQAHMEVIAPARFVPRGKHKLLFDSQGYSYRRDQLCGVKTHWRCTARKGCTARAHTVGNSIVKLGGTHTHAVPVSHEDQRSHEKDCADNKLLEKRLVEKFQLHSQDEGLLEYSQSKHFPTEQNHASAEKIYMKDKKQAHMQVIAPARLAPGRKHKVMLDSKGFIYKINKICGVKTYWHCTTKNDCTACVHTVENSIVQLVGTHNHAVHGSHEDQHSHEKDCADNKLLEKRQMEQVGLHSQDEGLLECRQSNHFPTEQNHASAEKNYVKNKKQAHMELHAWWESLQGLLKEDTARL